MINVRQNKIALKSLLMKNVKTDDKGRVLLTKDDEWRNETEWDKLDEEINKEKNITFKKANKKDTIKALKQCIHKYRKALQNLSKK